MVERLRETAARLPLNDNRKPDSLVLHVCNFDTRLGRHGQEIQAPSLYSHVPGKPALLELALTPLLDATDALLGSAPIGAAGDPDRQRRWLLAYRQLLDTHQAALRLVVGDLGISQHSGLAGRIGTQHALIRSVLASFSGTDQAHAAAVVGMLAWPVLWLPEDARENPQTAVDRAMAVLHPPPAAT